MLSVDDDNEYISHDVSECVFVYFSVIFQKKMMGKNIVKSSKKHIARAPCTSKCLAEVVIAEP